MRRPPTMDAAQKPHSESLVRVGAHLSQTLRRCCMSPTGGASGTPGQAVIRACRSCGYGRVSTCAAHVPPTPDLRARMSGIPLSAHRTGYCGIPAFGFARLSVKSILPVSPRLLLLAKRGPPGHVAGMSALPPNAAVQIGRLAFRADYRAVSGRLARRSCVVSANAMIRRQRPAGCRGSQCRFAGAD